MGEQGLRVLAFAARFVEDDELDAMSRDPMSLTRELGSSASRCGPAHALAVLAREITGT
jgi:hypothetical protein